jgi:microsomal epoxide hydrolase
MNSVPHFKTPVRNGEDDLDIHFIGLFSERQDAIPILLLHGWPGSILEFLPILSDLVSKYTPSTLPYHFIAPSLPGYAFSSPPPLNKDFCIEDIARVMNQLMLDLGFGTGYVVQGGDIGSKVGRVLAAEHDACRAVHCNASLLLLRSRCLTRNSELRHNG